jgi:hypothetical protein
MTSAIAAIGVSFGGFDVQDIDGLHLEITQGLNDSPTVRGIDVTVPGLDGQIVRPRKFHERRLLLSGFVRGSGSTHDDRQASYRANVRLMNALFDPALTPDDLVATLEDGSLATCAARTLDVKAPDVIPSEFAYVSIELLALEDWAYSGDGS